MLLLATLFLGGERQLPLTALLFLHLAAKLVEAPIAGVDGGGARETLPTSAQLVEPLLEGFLLALLLPTGSLDGLLALLLALLADSSEAFLFLALLLLLESAGRLCFLFLAPELGEAFCVME